MASVAVLGAGPHGHEIAGLFDGELFDDCLPGFLSCADGVRRFRSYIVGAVWPTVRRRIARQADEWSHSYGTVVFPGARISPAALTGEHAHILYNAVVSHGCRLGDYVTVCSGAVLAGEVTVGDDVFIGANASIIHGGIIIGRGAVIGAGAVVTRDVAPGETVAGVPARCVS